MSFSRDPDPRGLWQSLRVLLVEDSEDDALLLIEELRRGGFAPQFRRVETEAALRDALSAESWDIIIVDYLLPRFSGIAAIRVVREAGLELPIIMVSGKAGEETALEAMRASAQDYLLKGNLARLIPAIQRELGEAQVRREHRQSGERLRLLEKALESTINGVLITDQDGIITWINPAFTRMTGYRREEVIGQTPHILNSGKQSHTFYERMWAAIRAGEAWHGQLINRRKSGTLYTEEMTITPVYTGDAITHFVAIKEDITARKTVEKEHERLLAEVKHRAVELHAIFDAIVDPMAAFDAQGNLIRANPAMVLTIGHNPTGMTHTEIARVLSMRRPDGTLLVETEIPISRALQGESVVGERLLITDIDQHEMIVLVSATPLLEKARPWGVVSIWHDISKRERFLEEVQRRIAELDATINAVGDGLIIFSPTGEILLDNPAARRLLDGLLLEEEYSSAAPRWLSLAAHTPGGARLTPETAPGARAARGETITGEILVFRHRDGTETWTSVAAAPIRQRDDAIIGVVSTYTDITELHGLQREYQQLLEQQQDVMRIISHDLRAPLSVIMGHAQLAREYLAETHQAGNLSASIAAILTGAKQMNMMIQDMTDAVRQEGGQLRLERKNLALQRFFADELQRAATSMDISRLHLEIPADLPPVTADPDRLARIFTNLISNALKYSAPNAPVHVRARSTGGEVEVAVVDQGPGIAPEDIPHLFERFYRAKGGRKTEGIGLGLYITRMLVEAHGLPAAAGTAQVGGKIWVESAVDQGSTFYFTLPVAEAPE